VLQVPHPQKLLAKILNQSARPPPVPMTDHLVFNMTEDLSATNINAKQVVMTIEPSTASCGVEVGGNQVQSADLGDCALKINVAMEDSDEEHDEELLPANWEGVTVDDYD
jgi:hypothetical protein